MNDLIDLLRIQMRELSGEAANLNALIDHHSEAMTRLRHQLTYVVAQHNAIENYLAWRKGGQGAVKQGACTPSFQDGLVKPQEQYIKLVREENN